MHITVHLFIVDDSVIFFNVQELCNYHFYLVPKQLSSSRNKPHAYSSHCPSSSPAFAISNLLFVYVLACSGHFISIEWNSVWPCVFGFSLSMFLMFTHVVLCIRTSSIFYGWVIFHHRDGPCISLIPSSGWFWDVFTFLQLCTVLLWTCVYTDVCVDAFEVPLCIPRSGIAGSCASSGLNFFF